MQADEIREYAIKHYIQPARNRGDTQVTICAGDIHKRMEFTSSRMQAVLGALGAIKFRKDQNLQLISRTGDWTNTLFTFKIL